MQELLPWLSPSVPGQVKATQSIQRLLFWPYPIFCYTPVPLASTSTHVGIYVLQFSPVVCVGVKKLGADEHQRKLCIGGSAGGWCCSSYFLVQQDRWT